MTITNAMITEQIEKAVAESSSNVKIEKIIPMTDWIADNDEILTRDYKVVQPEKNSYFRVWIANDGTIQLDPEKVKNEKEFYKCYYKQNIYGKIPDNTDDDVIEEEIIDFFADNETNYFFDYDLTEIEPMSCWKIDCNKKESMEYEVTKFYSMNESEEEDRKEKIVIKDTSRVIVRREEKNFLTIYDLTDFEAEKKYNEMLEREYKKIEEAVKARAIEKETHKTYKNFEKRYIGTSDGSFLILAGGSEKEGVKLEKLCFGEDGSYYAYIVTEPVEIPEHYKKVTTLRHWLKIYDDSEFVTKFYAKKITVYRAGDFGCIIYMDDTIPDPNYATVDDEEIIENKIKRVVKENQDDNLILVDTKPVTDWENDGSKYHRGYKVVETYNCDGMWADKEYYITVTLENDGYIQVGEIHGRKDQ